MPKTCKHDKIGTDKTDLQNQTFIQFYLYCARSNYDQQVLCNAAGTEDLDSSAPWKLTLSL